MCDVLALPPYGSAATFRITESPEKIRHSIAALSATSVHPFVIRRFRLTTLESWGGVSVGVLPISDPIRHAAAASHPSSRVRHH